MSENETNGLDGLTDKLIAERKAQVAAWNTTSRAQQFRDGAVIYRANGDVSDIGVSTVKVFRYKQLSEIVGGDIDQQRLHDGRWMTFNDDGLALGLPFNVAATALYMEGRTGFTGIHGDVLVCSVEQIGE